MRTSNFVVLKGIRWSSFHQVTAGKGKPMASQLRTAGAPRDVITCGGSSGASTLAAYGSESTFGGLVGLVSLMHMRC